MVVLDTSTLILLAKSDLLPLLVEKTRIVIPQEVAWEALAQPALYDAQVIAEMVSARAIQVFKETPARRMRWLEEDFALGRGEAAALFLAKDKRLPLGTDDRPTIKAAKIMSIPFFTAIHVLIELYKKGRMDRKTALAKLETLQRVGRYSAQILADARERIYQ